MVIRSPANDKVRQAASLRTAKGREACDCYLVEGFHLVEEAIRQEKGALSVFLSEGLADTPTQAKEEGQLLALLDRRDPPAQVYRLSQRAFAALSDTKTPRGMAAVVPIPKPREETALAGDGNLLLLDRIQDPGNLGTLLRTAEAAGFQAALLMKGCGDPFAPKVVRAAAGTLFRLPLLFPQGPDQALALVRGQGRKLYGTAAGAQTPYWDRDLTRGIAIVLGNEGSGISRELLAACDQVLSIPMEGAAESLNAAAAGAVILFESLRQRRVQAHQAQGRLQTT